MFGGALHRDGASCAAACAEHEHAEIAQFGTEAFADGAGKAGAIGAEAGELSIRADDHGVHSACELCGVVGEIHGVEHAGLVRDGAVDADEARAVQQAERLGEFGGLDVQARVARGDAERGERGIVHLRRRGMCDGIADDRKPQRQFAVRRRHAPVAQILDGVNVLHD